jgi:hypothetical protein
MQYGGRSIVKAKYHFDGRTSRVCVTAAGTLVPSEQKDLGRALMGEVQRAPVQSLLVDLRLLNIQGELTLETVTEIASRWQTFAAEQRATIRFAIIAGPCVAQADYFADELSGSAIDVRVFSTKAAAVRWLDLPQRVDA